MKPQCLDSEDIISSLPQSIIENILTCMPIRDAVRTSILSRKWRFCWTSIPKLEFNDKLVKAPSNKKRLKKYKLVSAILHVLLLRTGSILEFSLDVGKVEMDSEFDQIIRYLSRNKNLQEFVFKSSHRYRYKLPSSFFSLQGLGVLELTNCEFKPPLKFNGYSMLKRLKLSNVTIASNLLQTLLSSCPLLIDLYLYKYSRQDDFKGGNKFSFVEILQCVPLIRTLIISSFYMKDFGAGGMPERLPTSLVHLKYLYVDMCLTERDNISSAFCLMRSSSNLEEIRLRILNKKSNANSDSDTDSYYSYLDNDSDSDANTDSDANSHSDAYSDSYAYSDSDANSDAYSDSDANSDSDAISAENLFDSHVDSIALTDFYDYSGFSLDYLKEFTMENFTNKDLECELMKLILARSPMLKTARIKLSEDISVKEEMKILRDMIRLPFPCASPSAVTIVEEREH